MRGIAAANQALISTGNANLESDHPMTLRQLRYQIFSRGGIDYQNDVPSHRRLGRVLTKARRVYRQWGLHGSGVGREGHGARVHASDHAQVRYHSPRMPGVRQHRNGRPGRPALRGHRQADRIFYLGDHDASGDLIGEDMHRRVKLAHRICNSIKNSGSVTDEVYTRCLSAVNIARMAIANGPAIA
jgi:hypothetical protein